MAKKLYDVVATVGSYTDRSGNENRRYENVGVMMEGDKGPYLMLKRTFNLAGVPSARDTVLLSLYEPQDDKKQQLRGRSEEHTSEIQSLMRNSYAGFCLQKTNSNHKA